MSFVRPHLRGLKRPSRQADLFKKYKPKPASKIRVPGVKPIKAKQK